MPETIDTKFDRSSLPKWAQKDYYVVYGCMVSLSFRCDVASAKVKQTKHDLIKKAHMLWPGAEFELATLKML